MSSIHAFLSQRLSYICRARTFQFLIAALVLLLPANPALAIERVSVASDGTQGNSDVWWPNISADGRFVAFMSYASNLVANDTNGQPDVFVHDRQTGATTRVSVAGDGTQSQGQGNYDIQKPSISADGRFVAFTSSANNLVADDTNGRPDVFVHDRQTGATTRISVASNGAQANSEHAYGSREPSISADGRFVAFTSSASNLVTNDTNGNDDVFLHDRQTGVTTLVSIANNGELGNLNSVSPSLSADGYLMAFASGANNLLGPATDMYEWNIFVHDCRTGVTTRVNVPSDGDQTYQNKNSFYPSISADGRFVAFESDASNLVANDTNEDTDIFVHDRQTGMTTRVSIASDGTQGNGSSYTPNISADGFFVAFVSGASNLVADDTNGTEDVFLHDRQTGTTSRVSIADNGTQGNDASFNLSISSDGRSVAFMSQASNLIADDTNSARDVFVTPSQPKVYSLAQPLDDQTSEIMSGRAIGQCLFGGFCARDSTTKAHSGIDYAVAAGTPVYALCDGLVLLARGDQTNIWNRFTIINHSNCGGFDNLFAYYGHITPTVKSYKWRGRGTPPSLDTCKDKDPTTTPWCVKKGQKIGVVSVWQTKKGSNAHLHLGLKNNYINSRWGYQDIEMSTPSGLP